MLDRCATQATLDVVTDKSESSCRHLMQLVQMCQNSTAPSLPVTSLNGITGTWTPAAITTTTAGTFNFVFTPNDPTQCGMLTNINVTVTAEATPTFVPIAPICQNAPAPALPAASIEGITGTWNPTTINTATSGTFTFTFTPNVPSQCANVITMDITVSRSELTVTKTASQPTYSAAGEIITYTIRVENTGNSTLSNITVTDPLTGLNANIPSMAPGAANAATYTQTYTILQSDVNAGSITNTANASGFCGPMPVADTDNEIITAVQNPSLTLNKTSTSTPNTFDSAGDILTYNIVVTNNGNVTLTNIVVSDALTTVTGSPIATLSPGESRTLTASYTATQNDLNAGLVYNTATARTTFGTEVVTATDDETVTATQTPSWTLTKVATETDYDDPTDILHYTITVENTGNVSISSVAVTDPGADAGSILFVSGDANGNNRLDPAEIWRYTATHHITLADIDAGHYANTATVTGNPPSGTIPAATGTADVPAIQRPELTIVKSTTATGFIAPGEIINYTLVVTNTGNVTVTGVTVSDPNAVVTCPGAPYTLTPGASRTCTAIHTVTAADVTATNITNTATVTGAAPNTSAVTGISNTIIVRLNNLPPEIRCPAPILTSTSDTSCDILISGGLEATFDDPNGIGQISSLTWTMTGATEAVSPTTGINNITTAIPLTLVSQP